ncbi:hypothetical protein BGLA2_1210022 [Burkholderia gladioli]|nr:hypothetical protein BGLA2_1210022 [Burkholderia gladioli]
MSVILMYTGKLSEYAAAGALIP